MKILRCDKCGAEKHLKQIVGTEFDSCGYKTLTYAYQTNEIKDLCSKCYEVFRKEVIKVNKNFDEKKESMIKNFLEWFK